MAASALSIQNYALLDDNDCEQRIVAAKQKLADRCIILGHHYQRDEVFRHADVSGDSLKLSRYAAESGAETIVFCGVHFMAEVADILSRPEQKVLLPDLAAGCSMADMANLANVERCWQETGAGHRCRKPGNSGHLYQLGGRSEGVLRTAWRNRLHLDQCQRYSRMEF